MNELLDAYVTDKRELLLWIKANALQLWLVLEWLRRHPGAFRDDMTLAKLDAVQALMEQEGAA